MKAVVELLEQYQPGYATLMVGAPQWCLDLLADASGVALPPFYGEFCRTMGANGGPVLDGLAPYHPEHLADLYSKARWLPAGRHLLVFGDCSVAQAHFFLDLEVPHGEDDAAVVRSAFGPDGLARPRPHAESLREMLILRAISRVCLPSCLFQARFVDAEGEWSTESMVPATLVELLDNIGFTRRPEVASVGLFQREDLALLVAQPVGPRQPWSCLVGLRDAREMKRLEALFAEYTPLSHA